MSLKDRLVRYMLNHHTEWIASGDLQRIVVKETDYTPRTAVRRLEELAEEGKLQVEYRKGHAFYKASEPIYNAKVNAELLREFDEYRPESMVKS